MANKWERVRGDQRAYSPSSPPMMGWRQKAPGIVGAGTDWRVGWSRRAHLHRWSISNLGAGQRGGSTLHGAMEGAELLPRLDCRRRSWYSLVRRIHWKIHSAWPWNGLSFWQSCTAEFNGQGNQVISPIYASLWSYLKTGENPFAPAPREGAKLLLDWTLAAVHLKSLISTQSASKSNSLLREGQSLADISPVDCSGG